MSAGQICQAKWYITPLNYNHYGAFNDNTSSDIDAYCDLQVATPTAAGDYGAYIALYNRKNDFMTATLVASLNDGTNRTISIVTAGPGPGFFEKWFAATGCSTCWRHHMEVTIPYKTANGNSIVTAIAYYYNGG